MKKYQSTRVRRNATVAFLTVALMFTGIPGVVPLHARRDPNCYVDLNAVFEGPQARSAFYVTLGTTGVGVGITLWGVKTKKKGKIIGGLILGAASAAGAVYFHREYMRYKNAETCGLKF